MYKKEQMVCNFGEHLMIDGYQGDQKKLNDKNIVLKCLEELPKLIKMRKLAPPKVYFAVDNQKKDPGGWSGYVIVAESHISIHTFPARGFVSIDVYSCKNGLDIKMIVNYFNEIFDLKDTEVNFVKRGTRYPQNNIC